jgi:hypothetical protein
MNSCNRSAHGHQGIFSRIALSLLAGIGFAAAAAPGFGDPLRPIALTGRTDAYGPQLGGGVAFSSFNVTRFQSAAPALSGSGSATFLATIGGGGVNSTNNTGVWAYRSGGLDLVARAGYPAPDAGSDAVFSNWTCEPLISDNDRVAFQAVISGPGIDNYTNDGLWTEESGALSLLIRENTTPVPDVEPSTVFGDILNPGNPSPSMWGWNNFVMNRAGRLALRCYIIAPIGTYNEHFGIWTDRNGTLEKHYHGGDAVPGYPDRFFCGAGNPRINGLGVICDGRNDTQCGAIWTDRTGTLAPIVHTGDTAPGTGGVWEGFTSYSINLAGRVAFGAQIYPSPTAPKGIWSEGRYGVVQLIALGGLSAPGTNGAVFANGGFGEAMLADNGVTAFTSYLRQESGVGAGNDHGLWSNLGWALHLVAREGSAAPGLYDIFGDPIRFGEISAAWINASGRLGFLTQLNDMTYSVWVEQSDGTLALIAREFTDLDVFGDQTDIRTIYTIRIDTTGASTSDGRRCPYNDDGDVAVVIKFIDGSEGVFTTSPAFVPGDLDGDGDVDLSDLAQLLGHYGIASGATSEQGDLDGDGDVDLSDLAAILGNYGLGL